MPGVIIHADHRLKIFDYLHRIGVDKLEVFLYSDKDKAVARAMLDR